MTPYEALQFLYHYAKQGADEEVGHRFKEAHSIVDTAYDRLMKLAETEDS